MPMTKLNFWVARRLQNMYTVLYIMQAWCHFLGSVHTTIMSCLILELLLILPGKPQPARHFPNGWLFMQQSGRDALDHRGSFWVGDHPSMMSIFPNRKHIEGLTTREEPWQLWWASLQVDFNISWPIPLPYSGICHVSSVFTARIAHD